MAIGIRPTVDYSFKRLFGNPRHERLAIRFLNAVLGGRSPIESVEFLNPLRSPESFDAKQTTLDVLARDQRQRLLNIEMQTAIPSGITERFLFYASSLLVGQLRSGMDYAELRPAISIWVLDGVLYPHVDDWRQRFLMTDQNSRLVLSELLEVHTLELAKRKRAGRNAYGATPLEKWAYFLNFAHQLTVEEIERRLVEPEYVEAAEILQMISQSPLEKEVYAARLKLRRDNAGLLKMARDEGIAIGEARGIEVGEARGVLLGQVQLLEKLSGVALTPTEDLARRSLEELETYRDQLWEQVNSTSRLTEPDES